VVNTCNIHLIFTDIFFCRTKISPTLNFVKVVVDFLSSTHLQRVLQNHTLSC